MAKGRTSYAELVEKPPGAENQELNVPGSEALDRMFHEMSIGEHLWEIFDLIGPLPLALALAGVIVGPVVYRAVLNFFGN